MERTEFEQWRSKEVARLLALVETERRYYQDVVAALPVPLAVLGADNSIVWANRSFRRVFGLRAEEVRRKDIEQLLPVTGFGAWIQEARAQLVGAVMSATITGQAAKLTAIPVRSSDEDSDAEMLIVLEIGAAQAPDVAVVPPDLPAIVWTADVESTDFRTVAGAAEEFLGYPITHWLNRAGFFEERIHPDDRDSTIAMYQTLLSKGGDGSAEFRAVTSEGQSFWCRESIRVVLTNGTPNLITGVLTSIERRKQLEQQLLAAGRVDAVQVMAGRLAHDLNNPLMIIHGYGEELLQSLDKTSPARADAVEIMTAAERISGVAARLTDLTRPQSAGMVRINLAELLAGLRARISKAAGTGVTLDMSLGMSKVWAKADAAQLSDVILTLASPLSEGALDRTRLTITCDVDVIAERLPLSPLVPGKYARILLRDDGHGLKPPQLAAIFDPALHGAKQEGLAMVRAYSLVREWGGDVACAAEPLHGTTFAIYLPYAPLDEETAEPAAPPPVEEPEPQPAPEPEPMRETILVVDDEAGIRGLMRKILRRERYQVLEASSAEEALQIAAAHTGPIHMLLTDVMLPGMLGPELARKMYALDSSLKVLYISGYTQDEAVRTGEYPPGARFLAKPFTLGALLGKVRESLDA
jgi:two-component system, cell cycle sensor histidine kinase and response regulator CckA